MRRTAWPTLLLAVAFVSFGSIFVRLAEAPPLAVAFWRVALASLLVLPAGRGALRFIRDSTTTRQKLALLGSGVALALHFATWIASLSHTSVAASVLIVNTAPLFTAALATTVLREAVGRGTLVALGLGLVGCVLVAWGEHSGPSGSLLGIALAFAGAATLSLHHVAGRGLRELRLSLSGYLLVVWSVAAASLLALALLIGAPIAGFPARSWAFVALLALVPTLGGHGLVNLSLRHLPAPTVGLFLLGEPLGAAFLALALFGEWPGPFVLGGGACIVAALALALLAERKPS